MEINCCAISLVLCLVILAMLAMFFNYSLKLKDKSIELEKNEQKNQRRIKELEKKNGAEQEQINQLKEQAKQDRKELQQLRTQLNHALQEKNHGQE